MKTRYLIPLLFLPFISCKKDNTPGVQPLDIKLNLKYASAELNGKLDLSKVVVKVTNLSTKTSMTYSPTQGVVNLVSIMPGEYDIDASITIPKDQYFNSTGEAIFEDVTFNAAIKKVNLTSSSSLDLELIAGLLGNFVIKQIYYAGSDNKEGAIYRDQFFEVYNNTDRVLYADSLYFGRLWGRQRNTNDPVHYQVNGQLDWSQSMGMTIGETANTDYVYLRDLFMIPGNGKSYPVEPGRSIVIAQNALNHKVPFIGNNGKEVAIKKPELTIDLSKASFEVHYGDIPGNKPFSTDIDNLDVPNVQILDYTGNDWILDNLGRDAYVIFKHSDRAAVENLPSYPEPSINPPSSTAKKYRQLPVNWMMDAVDVQPNTTDDRIPKKLPPALDAGFTFVTLGGYSSQSVIRKTDKTTNGVRKLKDTNNSTVDFVVIKANPFGFAD
ncbi:DUF4876 domain-containing protein [Sphingobacterium sp. HMA12]|uniref:DUF4876 domain-containing protein n=1 Tax=Sphingobacterium sp. HMA12 TaxID=2050894 RepID=UPI000CEA4469|nr:DUF4876 domain-containing protein [Sphingobacterium sp. HMA12]